MVTSGTSAPAGPSRASPVAQSVKNLPTMQQTFFFLVFLENSSLRALPESYLVKNTSHVPKYAEWSEELICTAEGIFFFCSGS